MIIFQSLAVARLIFILGVINLAAILALFFSCRCLMSSKAGARLSKYRPYQGLCKYHCHIWKVLWPSVVVHAFLAVMRLGWPG